LQSSKLSSKPLRPSRWPWRDRPRRVGADAAFAKAIARSEFGRFYADDQQMREVARSLRRAQGKRTRQVPGPPPQAPDNEAASSQQKPRARRDQALWRGPNLREQRSKLAVGKARLLAAARARVRENASNEGELGG
jgi:hypothetical protein